jgi:hypothetical protein
MSAVVISESIANMEKCLGKAGCSLKCFGISDDAASRLLAIPD